MAKKKLIQADGSPRPKLKPRGNPSKIIQYQFKKGQTGNPGGRSKAVRISEAVAEELARVKDPADGATRAGIIASRLLDRAEKDSLELERVLMLTEPELLANKFSSVGLSVQTEDVSVVFGKLLKD